MTLPVQTPVAESLSAFFRESPFAQPGEYHEIQVVAGQSLATIINQIAQPWQQDFLRVVLNGEVIAKEDWPLTVPNTKDVLNIILVPRGNDAGQIFKAIAVIVVVAVVSYFTAGALGPAAAGGSGLLSAGAAAAAGAAVGAVAGIAASLALNALFPPPVPGLPASSGTSGTEDPVYGFSRTGNQINKYGVIPRVYGRRKLFPQHAIAPYIIAKGTDQYLYQAFTAGYGPLKIEDLRIGDNPIGNYKDVEYFIHEGFVAGDELKIVKNDNWQDPYSIKLLSGIDNTINTADDTNAASLAIQFPQGLYWVGSNDGNRYTENVILDIQARQFGASTWNPITAYGATIDEAALNSSVTSNTWNTVGDVYSGDPHYAVVNELPASSSLSNGEFRTLATTTSDDYGNTINSYQDYQNSYTVATSTSQIKVEKSSSRPFFVNVNLTFSSPGQWEIKVKRIAEDREGRTTNPSFDTCFIASLRSIKNIPPIAPDKPLSLIELKIKATDQLNGAVNNLSCVATSILPIWTGSAWTSAETRNPAWAYLDVMRGTASKKPISDSRIDLAAFKSWADWCDQTQSNFAFTPPTNPNTATTSGYVTSLYYSLLFRVPDAEGLAYWVGKIDSNEMTRAQVREFFLQSQEASVINRARCDIEITSQTTAWDILKTIAATGYAAPTIASGKHSIAIDRPVTTPVQLFTPRNTLGFSGAIIYMSRPHALRISYTKTDETETDEIIVYDDGYNADGSGGKTQASVFETMKLVGVTRYNQAYTIGRRSLAQAKLRIETWTIQTDVENLLATRGSFVRFAHDVPKLGAGTARITGITGQTITIDEDFKLITGSLIARVRTQTGQQVDFNLSAVQGNRATVVGSTGNIAVGDVLVYGQSDRVTMDCLVKSIRPGPDLTAQLELIPYAPAIYTAETEAIPERNPWGSDWNGGGIDGGTNTGNKLTPGLVTSLLGAHQITYDNKTPRITVDLSWSAPVTGGTVTTYKVWYKDTAGWRQLGETVELTYKAFNEYTFTDADGNIIDFNGKALVFAVSGVGSDGSSLNPDYAKQVTVTPTIGAPNEIAALNATPHYLSNEVSWTFTNDPFATAYVELWGNTANSKTTAKLIAKVDAAVNSYAHAGLDPDQTWYYWLVAADGNGNYSAWIPATTTSTVSAKPLSAKTQYIDISGFTGFNQNAAGAFTPANATLSAIVTGITSPTYSWVVTGATTGAVNQASVTVTPDNSANKVTVTLTVNGANLQTALTKSITMPITYNGTPGQAGSNGVMSAFPTIYKWTASVTPPTRPTTTSDYTWSSGAFSPPSGWSATAPSDTTAGHYLWSITVPLNASATAVTSALDWTNTTYPIRCIAYNGTNGANGLDGIDGAPGLDGANAKFCYATTTLTLANTPATLNSSGSASLPAINSWGKGTNCRVASTANVTLSGTRIIDGVTVANGDRVLIKNQTTAANNGIYVVNTGGAWSRATDADTWSELVGLFTYVTNGTVNANTGWDFSGATYGTLGTTAISFAASSTVVPNWSHTMPAQVAGQTIYRSDGIYDPATGIITWNTPILGSGNNGSATYVITRVANDGASPTNAEVIALIGRKPVAGDICTVTYNNYNASVAYRYTTDWVQFTAYITGSLIVQKSLTAASGVFGDAAIDTLQIAGNAVTVPTAFAGSGDTSCAYNVKQEILSGSIAVSGVQPVIVNLSLYIGGQYISGVSNTGLAEIIAYVAIGSNEKTIVPGMTVDSDHLQCSSGSVIFTGLSAGTYTVKVYVKCSQRTGSDLGVLSRNPLLTILEAKR